MSASGYAFVKRARFGCLMEALFLIPNISYAESGTLLCVENLRVHILAKGKGFMLKERKFVISKADLK